MIHPAIQQGHRSLNNHHDTKADKSTQYNQKKSTERKDSVVHLTLLPQGDLKAAGTAAIQKTISNDLFCSHFLQSALVRKNKNKITFLAIIQLIIFGERRDPM